MSFMHQPHSAQGCLTTIQWMTKRQNCYHYFLKSSLPRSRNQFCGEVSASTPDNCECGQPGKEHSIYKILCTKYQKSWLVEGGNIPCFITMAMVTPSHNTWRAWWRNLVPFFWVSLENARKILHHEWHMVSVVSDCMAKRHKKHCVCCISFIKNPWSKKPDIHNKVMKCVSRNCHQNSLWTFYKHRKKAGVTKSGSDYGCFVIRTAGCSLVKE